MFIPLTLAMVVLTHLMPIAVTLMAGSAIWGLVLFATRPRPAATAVPFAAAPDPAAAQPLAGAAKRTPEPAAATPARLPIPAQSGERDPHRASPQSAR